MGRVIRSILAVIAGFVAASVIMMIVETATSAILVLDRYVRGFTAGHFWRRVACSAAGACRGHVECHTRKSSSWVNCQSRTNWPPAFWSVRPASCARRHRSPGAFQRWL